MAALLVCLPDQEMGALDTLVNTYSADDQQALVMLPDSLVKGAQMSQALAN
jgi:hypothetical protein